jgi:hypothetical protein
MARHAQAETLSHARRRLRPRARSDAAGPSKQEAEKVWEPKFIGEIVAGKDPHKKPA